MRKADIEALGEVAGEALAAGGRLIRDMHAGIATRPFGALGAAATPARVLHDGISAAVYGGIGSGLRGAARRGAQLAARHANASADASADAHADADADEPSLASHPIASLALGALNGLYGNHLVDRDNGLALTMDIRRHGNEVATDADGLAAAYPGATPRIVVFVHGLCETEAAWRLAPRTATDSDRRTYGDRLQDELGFTPVYLRYNTGLRVSANGRRLARLLEDLQASWPVGV